MCLWLTRLIHPRRVLPEQVDPGKVRVFAHLCRGSTMNWQDKVVLVTLAVWALIFGLLTVTNLEVVWGRPLMGFAALVLGIICLIRIFR